MVQAYVWNDSGIAACPRPIDRVEVLPDEDEDDYFIDDDQDD